MTDRYQDLHGNVRHWLRAIARTLDNPVYYDVGANKGLFVQELASLSAHVVAFEPVADTARQLAEAVAGIERPTVDVIVAGLGSQREDVKIHQYNDDTFNSLYDRDEEELSHYALERMGSETVRIIRLDDLLAGEADALACAGLSKAPPVPDIIKIDIEGAELSALQGMEHLLQTHAPYIVCEYSVDNTENAGYPREEILRLLGRHTYAIYGLFRNEDLHLYRAVGPRSIWNIVAVPASRHAGFQQHFGSSIREQAVSG